MPASCSPPNSTDPSGPAPHCFDTPLGRYLNAIFASNYVFVTLPLSVFILRLGVQRWRRRRSAATSHCDFITYNMAAMELLGAVSQLSQLSYYSTCVPALRFLRLWSGFASWSGQILFPMLSCVDQYLAVVQPVAYLRLRRGGGVRNAVAGCVWLLCFVGAGLMLLLMKHDITVLPTVGVLTASSLLMTFLGVSVLRVLIRPRPGEVGGASARADPSKNRAVYTILSIMAALWLKFGGSLGAICMKTSAAVEVRCLGEASIFVFSLPNTLLLFLLFLQRAGKLPQCRKHVTAG